MNAAWRARLRFDAGAEMGFVLGEWPDKIALRRTDGGDNGTCLTVVQPA